MDERNPRTGKTPERKAPIQRKQKPIRPKNGRPQKPAGDGEFNWSKGLRVILSWSLIIVVVFVVMTFLRSSDNAEAEISYTEYLQQLDQKNITEAIIKKSEINNFEFHGTITKPIEKRSSSGSVNRYNKFTVVLPFVDGTTIQQWNTAGFKYNVIKEDGSWINSLFSILPWIAIIGVWMFLMRRMQGGGGVGGSRGIFSFGKIQPRILSESAARVTFEDVAGADEAKQELREVIEFLREPEKFQRLGGKIPRGVLLLG